MSKKRGARILGPYDDDERNRWVIIEIDPSGKREYTKFDKSEYSEDKARRYVELLKAEVAKEDHTTATALDEYLKHLETKGTQKGSRDVTEWAIDQFFVDEQPIHLLNAKKCAALYEDLRTRPSKKTKRPLAADTHRNVLAQVKSFLDWCVKQRWLGENPCADVEGIGKRRPRGKSLGKSGNELRVKQARELYQLALFKARGGDEGAIAALVAILLGMRASEIVSRRVADLDHDQVEGDLLWIPCSKTPAGRRTLEVPEELRELLVGLAKDKEPERHLFEAEDGKPHWRDWVRKNVRRLCVAAEVPAVTAHAMRGLLATLTAERGLAGHLIAATLGHEDERTTMRAYAAPGSAAAGARRRGWAVLNGGVQVEAKSAK